MAAAVLLNGCSNLHCDLPGGCWGKTADAGQPLILTVGEEREVIYQGPNWIPTRSMVWGLMVAPDGVVSVLYPDEYRTHLKALQAGEAKLYFINRLSFAPGQTLADLSPEEAEEVTRYHYVQVIVRE
ncbi:hypothetical protein [Halioxenophilus sp. WMMB6]|uniref:hypothetical protein n=1 Tax=Halioxenophilus sp. WMMB6 TaxID=3073815 RepID=UPI00295E722A|nr:hypothetical protein [Halioxenophilus sp. WMMB6]